MPEIWRNWAGNQRALVELVRPTTEYELCSIVERAAGEGRRVRAVGGGRSFSDAAATDGVLISLEDYGRVLSLDPEAGLLTVQAGARLDAISDYLWSRGLALENPSGVGATSLAGATSTGSHGTGSAFGCMSTGIVGLRIVDGAGTVVDCDEHTDSDLLRVARIGLGTLGILSTLTMRVVSSFKVRVTEERHPVAEVQEAFDELVDGNDHFEFSVIPGAGLALTRRGRRNNEPLEPLRRPQRWLRSLVRPRASKGPLYFNERPAQAFGPSAARRFLEMEYGVPLEATMEALSSVRRSIDGSANPAMFSLVVRTAAADDIPLSTAYGRKTGYIAVLADRRIPHERYFRAAEAILMAHEGRPHWGTLHYRTAEDLATAYPRWEEFAGVRAAMDPEGVFANAYTRRVLGPAR